MFSVLVSNMNNGSVTHKCLVRNKDLEQLLAFITGAKNNKDAFSYSSDGSADAVLVCHRDDLDESLFPQKVIQHDMDMIKVDLMFDVKTIDVFDILGFNRKVDAHFNPPVKKIVDVAEKEFLSKQYDTKGTNTPIQRSSPWDDLDYDDLKRAMILAMTKRISHQNRNRA